MTVDDFGPTLKRLRLAAKMTQRELGALAKISFTYISDVESGRRGHPSQIVVERLASALGVPSSEFGPAICQRCGTAAGSSTPTSTSTEWRVGAFLAWALARIEECRRHELKFQVGTHALVEAVKERMTLTTAVAMLGFDVPSLSDETTASKRTAGPMGRR